jgi:transcription initiation factor TFIIH subunit 2
MNFFNFKESHWIILTIFFYLLYSHSKPTTSGYICARCNSKICDLPTDCPVCELTLVSSPHLARSYHHLFPVDNFVEVPWNRFDTINFLICYLSYIYWFIFFYSAFTTHCFSCQIPFLNTSTSSRVAPDTSGRSKCNKCNQYFCIDCDIFVHEVIHNCPGCLATTSSH